MSTSESSYDNGYRDGRNDLLTTVTSCLIDYRQFITVIQEDVEGCSGNLRKLKGLINNLLTNINKEESK